MARIPRTVAARWTVIAQVGSRVGMAVVTGGACLTVSPALLVLIAASRTTLRQRGTWWAVVTSGADASKT